MDCLFFLRLKKPNRKNVPGLRKQSGTRSFLSGFRNGDPKNDPTAEYARVPDKAKAKWKIMPWTKEWYALEDWEKEIGSDVYATNGVTPLRRRFSGYH